MLAIIQHLLNPELIHVAVPVIFNICVDFEPAQSQAAANRISYILLKLIKDGAIMEGSNPLSFAYELIEMASTKEQESKVEQSPDGIIQLITELALGASLDLAQFSCLVNSLVAYLEIQRFRDICILRNQIEGVLSILKQSFFVLIDPSSSDDLQTLPQLRLKINQSLAEVSGSPLFMETYSLDSTVSQTLISWLRTGNEEQLQICSCVMLGNLARTDEICQRMVRDLNIHIDLISILKSDSKGAVLHAALGFLKNLAIAPDNKVDLGDAGIIPAVSHLWGFETVPQVQFSAASIVRQVISSSIENVARLLSPLSTESGLPAHTQTYLSQLLLLFEKTDSTPIKIDIGRTVASICRTLSPRARDENSEANALSERLFRLHDGVARPVGAMVTQTQWPVVRSEGWFSLALMASSRPGSLAVVDCLQITDVYQSLKESLGAEIPEETTEADKSRLTKDGSNIIILVKELLGNASDVLPSDLKAMLHGFMRHDVYQRLKSTAE
ncbi:hypothetical protein MAP00_000536 [Monascus purpureus]|nr:hypothetical protein MAP00_000536 [Monascus purpureus]